jgi:hypothetical protein
VEVQLNSLHSNTGISNSCWCRKILDGTLRFGGVVEIIGLGPYGIPNKSQRLILA